MGDHYSYLQVRPALWIISNFYRIWVNEVGIRDNGMEMAILEKVFERVWFLVFSTSDLYQSFEAKYKGRLKSVLDQRGSFLQKLHYDRWAWPSKGQEFLK